MHEYTEFINFFPQLFHFWMSSPFFKDKFKMLQMWQVTRISLIIYLWDYLVYNALEVFFIKFFRMEHSVNQT